MSYACFVYIGFIFIVDSCSGAFFLIGNTFKFPRIDLEGIKTTMNLKKKITSWRNADARSLENYGCRTSVDLWWEIHRIHWSIHNNAFNSLLRLKKFTWDKSSKPRNLDHSITSFTWWWWPPPKLFDSKLLPKYFLRFSQH